MLNEPIAAHPMELLALLVCLVAFVYIMKAKRGKSTTIVSSKRVVSSRPAPAAAVAGAEGIPMETVAAIMAALEAYGGGVTKITAIRPLAAWTRVSRMTVLEQRNKNFG